MVGGLTVSEIMKRTTLTFIFTVLLAGPALAQDILEKPECDDGVLALIVPKGGVDPYYECNRFKSTKDDGADDIKDCLLYTSPSPRDRTRSRMPSSA